MTLIHAAILAITLRLFVATGSPNDLAEMREVYGQ